MLILSGITTLVWASFTWMGIQLLSHVHRQQLLGYPRVGQMHFYLMFPAAMLVLALIAIAIWRYTRFRRSAIATQVLVSFLVLPFLVMYGGGV
jgi:hypothetical protein